MRKHKVKARAVGASTRLHSGESRVPDAASAAVEGKGDPGFRQDDEEGVAAGSAAPNPADDAVALAAIFGRFRGRFPEDWDRLRLCPFQHGAETIGEMLKVARAAD